MKIGLFFGSFNPIHTGHLVIANYIADFYTEKIWFIISPQNPLKKSDELLVAENRLKLVQLAIQYDGRFEVLDIELQLPQPSYTIDTLRILSAKFPGHQFFLIIGSDNFLNFSKWKSANEIINQYQILVYERPGFTINKNNNENQNITFPDAPLIDISSTQIRKLIAEQKSIRYLTPENVYASIEKNGYYK